MDETVLDWTVPNWITVLLMVFLGFTVVGFGLRAVAKYTGAKAAE
jgi:hypothetical protein